MLVATSARVSTAVRRFDVGGAGALRGAVLSDREFASSKAGEALLRHLTAFVSWTQRHSGGYAFLSALLTALKSAPRGGPTTMAEEYVYGKLAEV